MSMVESWLYGSVARGTDREHSDLDVLLIADRPVKEEQIQELTSGLPRVQHLSVRRYRWVEINQMAAYGSLFLLHLKLEGRLIGARGGRPRLPSLLSDLPPYQLEDRDLKGFGQALDDVEWSLADGGDLAFELGVTATVIRHCSILACYKMKRPTFDTALSIGTSFHRVGLGSDVNGAVALYDFRLAQARGIHPGVRADQHLAQSWLNKARTFVRRVGEI